MDRQVSEMSKRNELLNLQMKEAEANIRHIDNLLKCDQRIAVDGYAAAERCEQFFSACYDGGSGVDEYNYFEFVPAGRLIVRSEHLGYLRLCDAWPNDVDLVTTTTEQALSGRKHKVLIRTNRRHCVDAISYFTARLVAGDGSVLPVELRNNNDGSYFAMFTPDQPGRHELTVQLFGVEIKGSPMQIDVVDDPDQTSSLIVSSYQRASLEDTSSCPDRHATHASDSGRRTRPSGRGLLARDFSAGSLSRRTRYQFEKLDYTAAGYDGLGAATDSPLLEPLDKLSIDKVGDPLETDSGANEEMRPSTLDSFNSPPYRDCIFSGQEYNKSAARLTSGKSSSFTNDKLPPTDWQSKPKGDLSNVHYGVESSVGAERTSPSLTAVLSRTPNRPDVSNDRTSDVPVSVHKQLFGESNNFVKPASFGCAAFEFGFEEETSCKPSSMTAGLQNNTAFYDANADTCDVADLPHPDDGFYTLSFSKFSHNNFFFQQQTVKTVFFARPPSGGSTYYGWLL
jgi:hypothetical protein